MLTSTQYFEKDLICNYHLQEHMYIRRVKGNHMLWNVTAGAVPTGEVSVICLLVYRVHTRETECILLKILLDFSKKKHLICIRLFLLWIPAALLFIISMWLVSRVSAQVLFVQSVFNYQSWQLIMESYRKRPIRSSSPATNPALTGSPLTHVPKHHTTSVILWLYNYMV